MATNRTDGMEALLSQCGLHGCFDPIVLACDVPHPKPAPDGALLIASRWNEESSRLLFIGDSEWRKMHEKRPNPRFSDAGARRTWHRRLHGTDRRFKLTGTHCAATLYRCKFIV